MYDESRKILEYEVEKLFYSEFYAGKFIEVHLSQETGNNLFQEFIEDGQVIELLLPGIGISGGNFFIEITLRINNNFDYGKARLLLA